MANEAGLLQITSMCEEALPQHELKTSIFKAIEAVVLNSPSDPELIEACGGPLARCLSFLAQVQDVSVLQNQRSPQIVHFGGAMCGRSCIRT